VLLLVFDVDHLLAVAAFADVAAAVGLVKVDAVRGESLVAVAALLGLGLHCSYYSNYCFLNIQRCIHLPPYNINNQ
jgi:hypothetical protein